MYGIRMGNGDFGIVVANQYCILRQNFNISKITNITEYQTTLTVSMH